VSARVGVCVWVQAWMSVRACVYLQRVGAGKDVCVCACTRVCVYVCVCVCVCVCGGGG